MADPPTPPTKKARLIVVSDLPVSIDIATASAPVLRLLVDLLQSVAANDDEEPQPHDHEPNCTSKENP